MVTALIVSNYVGNQLCVLDTYAVNLLSTLGLIKTQETTLKPHYYPLTVFVFGCQNVCQKNSAMFGNPAKP